MATVTEDIGIFGFTFTVGAAIFAAFFGTATAAWMSALIKIRHIYFLSRRATPGAPVYAG
ncbi:MAG TPA: hypothetical protein VKV15_28165 [Bryobacteraceae bacterium]|nr:hypothetical protein [Bryobacteraceae bacterium]